MDQGSPRSLSNSLELNPFVGILLYNVIVGILILRIIAGDLRMTQLIPIPWSLEAPPALHMMLHSWILWYVFYPMILCSYYSNLRIARDLEVTRSALTLWMTKGFLALQMMLHS